MISKLFKKNQNTSNIQKDLEDLFSRPIKTIEIEEEPEVIAAENPDLVQEEDKELSAIQIKVDFD